MTSFHDDFQYRVNYAATCIRQGIRSRRRDACYEHSDGDLVVTMLVRRAMRRPKFHEAVVHHWRGKFPQDWLDTAAKFAHIPDRDIPALAEKMRKDAHESFQAWLAETDAKQGATA